MSVSAARHVPAGVDWGRIPITFVALGRFVVPLHDMNPFGVNKVLERFEGTSLRPMRPVLAFSRWPDTGDVWLHDGRHRVIALLMSGSLTVPTRLLVIP